METFIRVGFFSGGLRACASTENQQDLIRAERRSGMFVKNCRLREVAGVFKKLGS
jgi:hypothetical protein